MSEEKSMVLYERAAVATIPEAQNLRALATDLLNSGLYPNIKNATQAIAVIATGQEIGLGPTASLTYIAPVNGRMTMESKLMLALFHRSGGRSKIIKRDKESCKVEFSKAGREPYVSEYTAEMAKAEQLWDKPTWKKMPETLLQWRAVSNGIKAYDPGVIMGIAMSSEEAEDYPAGVPETKAEPEKEAKKGPGRPRAEKPAPEVQKEPEKPAQATPDPAPAKPQATPPPAQAKKPENTGFEPEDELSKMSEELDHQDEEAEKIIADIKAGLEQQGVDLKSFKEWMLGHQPKMTPPRKFVVKMKNAIRFHGGNREDQEYLLRGITPAVAMFRYATRPDQDKE